MIEIRHLTKRYLGENALDHVSFSLDNHGFVSIVGPSGCGKSTLLHILAGIDRDYQGELLYDGKKVKSLNNVLSLSLIFQQFHLIPWLSAQQNLFLYDFFHRSSYPKQDHFHVSSFLQTSVKKLSLGQRQRIALERSLYYEPALILCDEPTASLDHENAIKVMKVLKERSRHALVLFVSHDESLVRHYSDRIITLADGTIVNDQILTHQEPLEKVSHQQKKHKHVPLLQLVFNNWKGHKRRLAQMSFALVLSLFCIMLTFTLSLSFRTTINDYINSLIPASSISFKTRHKGAQKIRASGSIKHVFYYPDDYELLGLSFSSPYTKNQTLTIGDETGYANSIIYGHKAEQPQDIVVPLSTAKKLSQGKQVNTLINRTIQIYYKHNYEVKGYQATIVGISGQQPSFDAFYALGGAPITWLQSLFQVQDIQTTYGILYYEGQSASVLKNLRKSYPDHEFKIVGETTKSMVNGTIDQAEMILGLFSLLAVVSSLFLIGESLYLMSVQMKKDYAIMRCYGARRHHIVLMSLFNVLTMHGLAFLESLALMGALVMSANHLIIPTLLNAQFMLSFSPGLMAFLYVASLALVMISSLFSLGYILHMDIVQALRGT